MKPEEIALLTEFNAWANRRVLAAVEVLTPEQFTRDLGSSYKSVRDTLAHILGVEWVWLERLQGRSPEAIPAATEYADVKVLRTRWAEVEKSFREYTEELTKAELDEELGYQTFNFGPGKNPRWQMIQHLVNHGSYHRGQVVTMLRQLGAKAVGTDLITFYRERNAAAAGA
jgi:uncharacterized damage-inducible protein DinB